MKYSWDEDKNRKNIEQHGIAFKDAVKIFEGETLEQEDDRFEYGEVRIYAIGIVNALEIVVIYTDKDNNERRIISARRAEPHERRAYWRSQNEY
jgi:uncharacterized DUF497 family protein